MAEVERLHHTGFTVTDLERSLVFYRDLLGFDVVAEQEKQGGYLAAVVAYPDAHAKMAHLKAPGSDHRLELIQYLSPEPVAVPLEPRLVGPTHVCLTVDDLPALYERLLSAGVDTFFTPPVEVDTGINKGGFALYLRDPDGIILELFQAPRRE